MTMYHFLNQQSATSLTPIHLLSLPVVSLYAICISFPEITFSSCKHSIPIINCSVVFTTLQSTQLYCSTPYHSCLSLSTYCLCLPLFSSVAFYPLVHTCTSRQNCPIPDQVCACMCTYMCSHNLIHVTFSHTCSVNIHMYETQF